MTSLLKTNTPDSAVPEVKGYPIIGNALDYRLDPLSFYTRCAQYGDFVRLRFGSHPVYFLNHPDLIKEVFVTQGSHFLFRTEGREAHFFAPIFGNGLAVSHGDYWKRQRHLVQSAFHRQHLATYGQFAVTFTQQQLATWSAGSVVEMRSVMMQLMRRIITAITFGEAALAEFDKVDATVTAAMREYHRRSQNWLLYLLPADFPTPGNVRYHQAVEALDQVLYALIQQRRADRALDTPDMLSLMLQAKDEAGQGMSDVEIRDELVNVVAGHDSVADVFAWTWWLLAQHPEVEEKLLAEWKAVLDGRSPIAEDVPKLRYTEAVVTEVLRLYPLAWVTGRVATEDCEIGGHSIHAGEHVVMSQWVTHHDPRFFEQPQTFRPERWTPDQAKQIPTYAYFPFGGGARACIGRGLTMMEAVLLLPTIGQKFQLKPVPGQPIKPYPWPSFSLRPMSGTQSGIQMQLVAR